MTRDDTEIALTRAGQAEDDRFDLFEAALACALHEDPSRDPGFCRALFDDAASRLAERLEFDLPDEATRARIHVVPGKRRRDPHRG